MTPTVPISIINEAVREVAANLPDRLRSGGNWRLKGEDELWRELVAAILGSAVPYEQAISALLILDAHGFTKSPSSLCWQEVDIERSLRFARYRFPALRSQHIAASAAAVYGASKTLHGILHAYGDAVEARRGLVGLCPGLGPKQASLFLRNVGYYDLAVLDRHVLGYLYRRQLIGEPTVVVSSVKKYEVVEQIVVEAATELGLTVADFDLAVWITMRSAMGASRQWDS